MAADMKLRECCEVSLEHLRGTGNVDAEAFIHGLPTLGLQVADAMRTMSTLAGHLDRYMSTVV